MWEESQLSFSYSKPGSIFLSLILTCNLTGHDFRLFSKWIFQKWCFHQTTPWVINQETLHCPHNKFSYFLHLLLQFPTPSTTLPILISHPVPLQSSALRILTIPSLSSLLTASAWKTWNLSCGTALPFHETLSNFYSKDVPVPLTPVTPRTTYTALLSL